MKPLVGLPGPTASRGLSFGSWFARDSRAADPCCRAGQLPRQETIEIAELSRGGHSKPEIRAQLFISPRTVEYHLRKVLMKLEISSRNELQRVLPSEAREAQPV